MVKTRMERLIISNVDPKNRKLYWLDTSNGENNAVLRHNGKAINVNMKNEDKYPSFTMSQVCNIPRMRVATRNEIHDYEEFNFGEECSLYAFDIMEGRIPIVVDLCSEDRYIRHNPIIAYLTWGIVEGPDGNETALCTLKLSETETMMFVCKKNSNIVMCCSKTTQED